MRKMNDFMDSVMLKMADFFDGLLDTLLTWFMEIVFAPFAETCLSFGTKVYNIALNETIDIMTKSPQEWNSYAWGYIVTQVNNIFIAFGCTLVVIFFSIGFISESVDIRREIRIETILGFFFKLSISQFFVLYTANIVTFLFGLIPELAVFQTTVANEKFNFSIDIKAEDIVGISSAGVSLLTVVLSFICMVVFVAAGLVIMYTAYVRFFKVLLLIPFGAIASATIAGNQTLNRTATAYWKYMIGIVLEGVFTILLLVLFKVIVHGGGFDFIASEMRGNFKILGTLIDNTLFALLCLGLVKGAGALVQRVLSI